MDGPGMSAAVGKVKLFWFNWPSHVGGADTKFVHLLPLLSGEYDITVVPNEARSIQSVEWTGYLDRCGVKYALFDDLPARLDGWAVALCNGPFLKTGTAAEMKRRGARLAWSNEMMWHFEGELEAVRTGLFDCLMYVSPEQRAALEPGYLEACGAAAGLMKLGAMEERIYRLRCVEGWSMVVPWVGYSLAELVKRVEPTGNAKYVEFVTLADPKTMPFVGSRVLEWPYVEGLRIDEAMHPLTLLAFGLYGEVLPNQNGAPVRAVVPWKYGFKSGKSIVKIRFTEKLPATSWVKSASQEYGFFSNVNPEVDHPRWSQATERRIGEDGLFAKKRATLMFNGYGPQVAPLYAGMDLKKFF